jgi:hypothetical protein
MTGPATMIAAIARAVVTPAHTTMRQRPETAVATHAPVAVDMAPASSQYVSSTSLSRRRAARLGRWAPFEEANGTPDLLAFTRADHHS